LAFYFPNMTRLRILAAGLLAFATVAITAEATVLDAFRGDNRYVLLFAKSRSNAAVDRQISLFAERRPDLRERDMVVLITTMNRETMAIIGYASIPSGAGRRLIDEFKPRPDDFTVVLVDRSGSEIARWQGVVDPQTLFDLIDSQPEAGL
jgi:hypothetical protein